MRRVRSFLPFAFAGLVSFSLARWWPAPRESVETTVPSPATPAPIIAATAAAPPAPKAGDGTKQRVGERFTSNFKDSDPFGSARRLLPEIEAMTADDFRELEKQKNWPSAKSYGFDREFADAFDDALVERWLAVDPEGSVAAMFRLSKSMDHGSYTIAGANDMLEALARIRPEVFLSEVLKPGPARSLGVMVNDAFRSLATRDVAAARRWLDRLTNQAQRDGAEVAIGSGVAQSDPVAAVALAREARSDLIFRSALNAAAKMGPGVLGQVLEAGEGTFRWNDTTALLMFRHPDFPWESLNNPSSKMGSGSVSLFGLPGVKAPELPKGIEMNVLDEATCMPSEGRERALAQLQRLPSGMREGAVGALIHAWGLDDAKSAMDWVAGQGDASGNGAFASEDAIFRTWMRADSKAALDWFSALPPSSLRDRLANHAAIPLVTSGDPERGLALFCAEAGAEGAAQVTQMAVAQAKLDPARAAAWCESLPPDIDANTAMQSVVEAWFPSDAEAAAKSVEGLPEGKRRETALNAYAHVASKQDPEVAAAWAAAIKDPLERTRAAHQVFNEMSKADKEAALKWVREFPGLDQRVRETILRAR